MDASGILLGIDAVEIVFFGEGAELFDEGGLIGDETVVEIVAVVHVEAGFPVIHFAGF